ncbi:MAG: hypothetical protein V1913_04090, partial [Fibrobacterota bacterium]
MSKNKISENVPVRVAFFGSYPYSVTHLAALCADPCIRVTVVVTRPDRVDAKGLRIFTTPVSEWCERSGYADKILKPEKLT